jgi:ADP-ribose pyrophosphatase
MSSMDWKVLASKYIMKDTWNTVRVDRCELPNGKILDPYYVYEFTDWANAFAVTKDNKVVMVRQYRHGLGVTNYELPGGCVDEKDASLQEAVARELREETGYTFEKYEYLGKVSPNPATHNNWMHMFLATGGTKTTEQDLDAGEDIQVALLSIEEVKQLLVNNQLAQSMHVSNIMYALIKLGQLTL